VGVRDKLAARARPYLEPGEQIQAVFEADTFSPNWQRFIIVFACLVCLIALTLAGFTTQESASTRSASPLVLAVLLVTGSRSRTFCRGSYEA
jgi:hypothetical protein